MHLGTLFCYLYVIIYDGLQFPNGQHVGLSNGTFQLNSRLGEFRVNLYNQQFFNRSALLLCTVEHVFLLFQH